MHRRKWLIVATIGASACLPFLAHAQKVWRVGYLNLGSREASRPFLAAFSKGMRELGYVEGRNLKMEWRFADGKYERLLPLATELVNLKVDVLVASVTPSAGAARKATSTIPIVMGITTDPVGAGLVQSLARPGGNVTGTSAAVTDYVPKQLELMRRIVPNLSAVSFLLSSGNRSHGEVLKTAQAVAGRMGVRVSAVEVRSASEIEKAFETLAAQGAKALIVAPDGLFMQQRRQLAQLEAKHDIAVMYQSREHTEAGGLMSYGQDLSENFRLAASYVDRILRGANPADLPVEQVSKLELVINGKTATARGLIIPRDVRLMADRIIE